jgi:ribose transport system substrate-binding protein
VISSEWNGWAAIDTLNSVFLKQPPVDSGIGWTFVDKDNGLPASGEVPTPIDFRAASQKAWGVG